MKLDVPGLRCILLGGEEGVSGRSFEIRDGKVHIAHNMDEVASAEVIPQVPCEVSIDFFV